MSTLSRCCSPFRALIALLRISYTVAHLKKRLTCQWDLSCGHVGAHGRMGAVSILKTSIYGNRVNLKPSGGRKCIFMVKSRYAIKGCPPTKISVGCFGGAFHFGAEIFCDRFWRFTDLSKDSFNKHVIKSYVCIGCVSSTVVSITAVHGE